MARKLNHVIRVKSTKRSVGPVDQVIGIRIRARRLEMKMSQTDLANRLGLTFQQVQKYEKGVNRITIPRVVDLARILETDTSYFMVGLGGPNGEKKTAMSRFADFMATADGVAINDAMIKLNDAYRREVIGLARTLARAYAT